MGVDAVAIRSSAEADEHRRNRRAVEDAGATSAVDVVAIRNSVVATEAVATEAEADAHRRNRLAVEDAVATSAVATGDRAARHRWTVRAVRRAAARWPVAVVGDGARAQALLAEAVAA